MEQDYRDRLLIEYTDVVIKVDRLRNFLEKNTETQKIKSDEYLGLLKQQLEAMTIYKETLFRRIFLEMKKGEN